MIKLLISLITLLFSTIVFAVSESALNFTPPPSDVSVIFLANIFGVVDGVLHGSGSQIMGVMFGVFNAAVLALGGIVIMYTLIVSTINTAHEGQMLGQKWSSVWVPLRATFGLALLIPKASGYCIMQIFFMWVIVQGVGAADKVWEAALGYLNRGGVIVQQQIEPITMVMGTGSAVASGAASILYSQLCMLGLEAVLKQQRQELLDQKSRNKSGPCAIARPGTPGSEFCNNPVPDLLGTVNALSFQSDNPPGPDGVYSVRMPTNLPAPYNVLDGICGTVRWKQLLPAPKQVMPDPNIKDPLERKKAYEAALEKENQARDIINGITAAVGKDGFDTVAKTRAIAVQQLFTDLAIIAQIMVGNNPVLTPSIKPKDVDKLPAPFAVSQFGIPMTLSGAPCPEVTLGASSNCKSWGPVPGSRSAALFNGTEFQGAIADYNAIMQPSLNLISQAKEGKQQSRKKDFIQKANRDGWMLAGSYFFALAALSEENRTTGVGRSAVIDTNSGLAESSFELSRMVILDGMRCIWGEYSDVCAWFEFKPDKINAVQAMINGKGSLDKDGNPIDFEVRETTIPAANDSTTKLNPYLTTETSSTGFGFVNNSLMVSLPGQAGTAPGEFVFSLLPNFIVKDMAWKPKSFPCDGIDLYFVELCFGRLLGEFFYNFLFLTIINNFITIVATAVNAVLMAFLALPLIGMAEIFKNGVLFIQQPDTNPVIALANMGINYINFAMDLWMYLLILAVAKMFLGPFAVFVFVLILMAMPLLIVWLFSMVTIGFLTAYYVPFMPYMIFTFGAIAWLIAVIEAMVAAPLVALAITHPEGEGPLGGKAEHALMYLMNVFLRPALMIIGFIAGIMLSFVGTWVLNAGFFNILPYILGKDAWQAPSHTVIRSGIDWREGEGTEMTNTPHAVSVSSEGSGEELLKVKGRGAPPKGLFGELAPPPTSLNYVGWAGIYAFFFAIITYTMLYFTIVQKAFSLIGILPDKILRWIGGQPDQVGQEAMGWAEEPKKQLETTGRETGEKGAQIGKEAGAKGVQAIGKAAEAVRGAGPTGTFKGGDAGSSTPSPPDGAV